jgi:uncharacterized membrane protein YfcA
MLKSRSMKSSKYKPKFWGAFVGLLIASFYLVFTENGDMEDWERVTIFAACAWVGLRIASWLASRKKKENQD